MRFLTIRQFCETVGVSRATYYRWRAAGKTPTETKVGNTVRILDREIEKWAVEQAAQHPSSSDAGQSGRTRTTASTKDAG